jgi:integral membrane protein (TIGR01906 family)
MSDYQTADKEGKFIYKVLSWLATFILPIALTLTATRLMFTPLYLRFEYNAPGFPADPYGFSTDERLKWSQYALDYLLNDAGIAYLSDLKFEDGQPIYNERELGHMLDVKNVVQVMFKVLWGSWIALVGLGMWAWFGKWWDEYRRGLGRGGWLTIFMVGGIVVFALLSFGVFFVAFHNVFFEPGTWTFNFSDTLIRLFPERFWRDIFLFVGGITLAGGLLFALAFRKR